MLTVRYRPLLSIAVASCLLVGCKTAQRVDSTPFARLAQAGCATCIFGMKDVVGCKLAVKIDGKPYLLVGSDIDDHGDAHAADGLCLIARDADVTGTIEGDRFVATSIKLRP